MGPYFFGPEFSGPKFSDHVFRIQTKIKNFQNDVDMSADPLEGLNFISSSETFNFDVRAHQGLNLDTECSFNEFMPQGVANETSFVPSANQNQESGQPRDQSVFDCNIKSEILRDEPCQPQTSQHQSIPGRSLEPEMNQPKTGNTGSNIYQIPNDPKMTDNIVRTSGPSKSTMLQSQSILVQGSQVQQRPIAGPKIVQGPIHIEPQPSEEEIKAKKEEMKAAKKGDFFSKFL